MVIWLIGLSGAGKTTLANEVMAQAKKEISNIVLLDGDMVREAFANDLGYTLEDRRKNADRICNLCKLLDDQGIHVVCAILSLFSESRKWNRENIKNYYEVFIDVPVDDLMQRDPKGLYASFSDGKLHNMPGLDVEFKRPLNSDLVIDNCNASNKLLDYSNDLVDLLRQKN